MENLQHSDPKIYGRILGRIFARQYNQLEDAITDIAGDILTDGFEHEDIANFLKDTVDRVINEIKTIDDLEGK